MRIVLPFPYTVGYSRRRKGQLETATHAMIGHVVADAPELSRNDYSKVAEWDTAKYGTRVRNTCISFLDELYVPVVNDSGSPLHRLPDRAEVAWPNGHLATTLLGSDRLSLFEQGVLRKTDEARARELQVAAKVITESNRESRKATAQTVVESLIFSEGHFWRRIPWIAIKARHVGDIAQLAIEAGPTGFDAPFRVISDRRSLPPHFELFYALDQEYLAKKGVRDGALAKSYASLNLLSSSPDFDGGRDYLDRCMLYVLNNTCAQVGGMPIAAAADWMALRQNFLEADGPAPNADEVVSLMTAVIPYVVDEHLRRYVEEAIETVAVYFGPVEPKTTLAAPGFRK